MVVVVSDTTPIRALAHLQQLELLRQLFDEVVIPPAVAEELNRPAAGGAGVDIGMHAFIRVQQPANAGEVARFRVSLDPGESEALTLAGELGAEPRPTAAQGTGSR